MLLDNKKPLIIHGKRFFVVESGIINDNCAIQAQLDVIPGFDPESIYLKEQVEPINKINDSNHSDYQTEVPHRFLL